MYESVPSVLNLEQIFLIIFTDFFNQIRGQKWKEIQKNATFCLNLILKCGSTVLLWLKHQINFFCLCTSIKGALKMLSVGVYHILDKLK